MRSYYVIKRTEYRMTRNFFQGNSNLKRIHNIKHRVDTALKTVEKLSEDQNNNTDEDDFSFGWKKKRKNNMMESSTQNIYDEANATLETSDLDCQQHSDEDQFSEDINNTGDELSETVTVSRKELG